MAGVMIDSAILNSMLQAYLPDLYNHFMSIGYELNLNNIIYRWFLSAFIQNIPYEVYIISNIAKFDHLGCVIPRR